MRPCAKDALTRASKLNPAARNPARKCSGLSARTTMTEITRQEQWKRGAILLPIQARAPHGIVFVERAQHLRRHPGELGFPGGLEEPSDGGDPVRTALRELAEELTVGAEHVSVVGRLPHVEQSSSRLQITPIVGVLDASSCISADNDEIVGTFSVPLRWIIDEGAIYENAELSRERANTIYAFDYEGRRIWGFTARILKSFVEAWTAPPHHSTAPPKLCFSRDLNSGNPGGMSLRDVVISLGAAAVAFM